MTERRRLVRESPARPASAGRLERAAGEGFARGEGRGGEEGRERWPGGSRDEGADEVVVRRRSPARDGGRWGRPSLVREINDVNRGLLYVGVESAAIAMDVAARILRGAVDRAFDEDYDSAGDVVRGLTGEADKAVYDLVGELRRVPRRLSHRFEEVARSPRAEQGERQRRADAGGPTPADSPAAVRPNRDPGAGR
ncbi:MAG TPA: hypothetical protein VFS00_34340 [Polyangiaceae bacterium]|nr:hypothetical protein [Polyangiaceae bacterium]